MAGLESVSGADRIRSCLRSSQTSRRPPTVANIYGDAGPDLVTVINNVPTISNTIVDQQENLNATLLADNRLGERGLRDAGARRGRLHRGDPAVAGAVEGARRIFARIRLHIAGRQERRRSDRAASSGGIKPGAMVSSSFVPGRAVVHISGEPADRERVRRTQLPRTCPTSPASSSAARGTGRRSWSPTTPTSRAEPFTEVQVDAAEYAAVPLQWRVRRTGRFLMGHRGLLIKVEHLRGGHALGLALVWW